MSFDPARIVRVRETEAKALLRLKDSPMQVGILVLSGRKKFQKMMQHNFWIYAWDKSFKKLDMLFPTIPTFLKLMFFLENFRVWS